MANQRSYEWLITRLPRRCRSGVAVHSRTLPVHAGGKDLYFPLTNARYEAQFMSTVELVPIPSLWGHPAGAGVSAADKRFLNENIGRFLGGR
jgi:hypothetical protein